MGLWLEFGSRISPAVPIVYIGVALAWRSLTWRKARMSPFDSGTSFPRSFHPFAPPSYAERAVPELTRRIWWLHDNECQAVLTAHSQGSMVAAAVLAHRSSQQGDESRAIGLVTLGAPLAKLYRWVFPALVSDGLPPSIAAGRMVVFSAVRWRNVHYATDYIGGPIQMGRPEGFDIDVELVDPPTDKSIFGQPLPHVLSHTGYWVDARFWAEVENMCVRIGGREPYAVPHIAMEHQSTVALTLRRFAARAYKSYLPPRSLGGNGAGSRRDVSIQQQLAPDPTTPPRYNVRN